MPKKLTIEFITQEYAKEGYKVLNPGIHKNSITKFSIMCPKGHVFEQHYNSWKNGKRCRGCYLDKTKLTTEFITQEYAKEGYKVLNPGIHKNSITKFSIMCPKGHMYEQHYKAWKNGRRCPSCAGLKKLTTEFIIQAYAKENYKVLNPEVHKNSQTQFSIMCPKGHVFSQKYKNWNSGNRCHKCYLEKIRLNAYTNEQIISIRRWRKLLSRVLTATNQIKKNKTVEELGYSHVDLMNHLKSFSYYENIKDKRWAVDHILPVKAFVDYKIDDVKVINHLSNLQPLLATENASKKDKYNYNEFKAYVKQFGYFLKD